MMELSYKRPFKIYEKVFLPDSSWAQSIITGLYLEILKYGCEN